MSPCIGLRSRRPYKRVSSWYLVTKYPDAALMPRPAIHVRCFVLRNFLKRDSLLIVVIHADLRTETLERVHVIGIEKRALLDLFPGENPVLTRREPLHREPAIRPGPRLMIEVSSLRLQWVGSEGDHRIRSRLPIGAGHRPVHLRGRHTHHQLQSPTRAHIHG